MISKNLREVIKSSINQSHGFMNNWKEKWHIFITKKLFDKWDGTSDHPKYKDLISLVKKWLVVVRVVIGCDKSWNVTRDTIKKNLSRDKPFQDVFDASLSRQN